MESCGYMIALIKAANQQEQEKGVSEWNGFLDPKTVDNTNLRHVRREGGDYLYILLVVPGSLVDETLRTHSQRMGNRSRKQYTRKQSASR